MRIKQLGTSGSSAGSTSEGAISPGKRTLTETVRRRAKASTPVGDAESEADAAVDAPIARSAAGAAASASPGATFAAATSGGGSEIPYRSEMEGAFGEDFGGVSSHVGQRDAMDSLGAHAAASGESVAFGSATPDKHTVAHELTHVVQHRRGSAGMFGSGGLTDPSDASEVEAERVAGAVVAGERVQVAGGAGDGISLARKPWAERQADLLTAIDARILQITPAAAAPPGGGPPGGAPLDAAAAPPDAAAPVAAPPGVAVAPDPAVVTVAELQTFRGVVTTASDDTTMDAATARGVTLFAAKAPAERERFDGWVRTFGGVEGGAAMDTFLQFTDGQAASLMADTAVGGLAQELLMRTFESNWFKAKECLVFWRWPGEEPAFSRATGLELMTALTKLRGAVHTEASARTQAAINGEIAATAEKQQATNPALAETLASEAAAPMAPRPEGAPAPAPAVEFKGSVGADTVTSDVDVSTGGANTEIAVRVYNEQFRALMGTAFDPGTVFDLNVYSKDFIFKPDIAVGPAAAHATITPGVEHPDAEPTEPQIEVQDEEQDIFALVHVARYMPSKAEWDAYAARVVDGITNPAEKKRQRGLMLKAWDRVEVFNRRLGLAMDSLKIVVDAGIAELGQSSWQGEEGEHFDEGALKMRAANKLYEQELIKVKDIRAQIEACGPAEEEKKGRLAAELTTAISAAQLFANEVYGSRGGTVHAVIAVQVARKKAKELGKPVDVIMPPALWHETFNDNLGDVLKDYQHYGHASGDHAADYGYAAFKMGKYADRMVDAVPHLGDGGEAAYLGGGDLATVQASPQFVALVELSREHVTAKNGPASNNPALLAENPYFAGFDAGRLAAYKDHAIQLGADVRAKVAQHRSTPVPDAAAAPDEAQVAEPEAAQPPPGAEAAAAPPPGPDPRPILGAMTGRVRELIARAEAASKAGPTES